MSVVTPDWPVPTNVKSFFTTRAEGHSKGDFDGLNLASHVGDSDKHVLTNRSLLTESLSKMTLQPLQFSWLNQVHGTTLIDFSSKPESTEADGVKSRVAGEVCLVMTADCLPVLICDKSGYEVAAVHAGWRGLAKGILHIAVSRFSADPEDLLCYLGPAISKKHFQVGEDVLKAFVEASSNRSFAENVRAAFETEKDGSGKYRADLYQLARIELKTLGVQNIFGGSHCTYSQNDLFYSFRRDGTTGRMACGIWLES